MDETSELGFLSALGEEFCEALSPPVPWDRITPHDGYEVWRRVFGTMPTPIALVALSDQQTEQLREACVGFFECPGVSVAQVKLAVSRTLARWPA